MSVTETLEQNLREIETSGAIESLSLIRRGIEKESLRIDNNGLIAQTPHPRALGSALTHPYITTDYSEALLEFVTPVSTHIEDTLSFLETLHAFAYRQIGDEILWVNSMPCTMPDEEDIPIAQFGSSNVGRMKHVYRRGLGYRYGRVMQTIAGIHYNFSLPDTFWDAWLPWGIRKEKRQLLISQRYFAAIRNFHRYCWLLFYLFGASPAVCKSFVEGRNHGLDMFDDTTFYGPAATTLRMSSLGYHNPAQSEINICYNGLDRFVTSLRHATETPYPPYEEIGVKVDGEYRQLNANMLQIENEYYAVIRPKRVAFSGEKPSHALESRGVEYIEVRCLDLNPFSPIGIDADTARFVDLFLLYCLFTPSPEIKDGDYANIYHNKSQAALKGRDPELMLVNHGDRRFRDETDRIMDDLTNLAALMDQSHANDAYGQSLDKAKAKLAAPELTPSAQVLTEMRENRLSFVEFAMRQALFQAEHFSSTPIDATNKHLLSDLAQKTLDDQAAIEAADKFSFDEFLTEYFNQ